MDEEQEQKESRTQRILGKLFGSRATPITPSTPPRSMPLAVSGQPAPSGGDELADLFEGPKPEDNDMVIDHLVDFTEEDVEDLLEVDEEEGVEDLLSVGREDIMGSKPKPKLKLVRTNKPYPPAGLSGMR